MNHTTAQARPYRSHRVPACDRCRQRKIRCKIATIGQPCELCAEKGFNCLFSGSNSRQPTSDPDRSRPRKRPRVENVQSLSISGARTLDSPVSEGIPVPPRDPAAESEQSPLLRDTAASSPRNGTNSASGPAGEASIIVGPMVAEDVQILQRYLTAEPRVGPQPYSVVSNAPGDPIFLALPRHREGLQLAKDSGRGQREILDQILGPKKRDVIQLYFKHIHPAFPVLDEELVSGEDGRKVSSTLLCEIYAISLTFWHFSDTLKHHHCPSEQYFWNLAIAALQDDFLAPNLYTLYSSMIDLLGRPVGSVQGNVINSGRTMALVHSLGLNRNPSAWRTSAREKDMRVRIFWGCMVLDQW